MAPAGRQVIRLLRIASAAIVLCALVGSALAQQPNRTASAKTPSGTLPLPPTTPPISAPSAQVIDIKIEGNRKHQRESVLNVMSTRIGHPFDQAAFEMDVRKLTSRNWFVHVVPRKEFVPGGVVITLSVVERPTLEYVRYFGYEKLSLRVLKKETGLKVGDSFDPYAVREAARKIESLYHSKGFNDATVDVPEGTKPGDHGAVFLINEGKKLKFADISFVGNSREIAPDGRLKKVVQSREPILFFFKGEVDRQQIEQDKERLVDYYRGLGFFKAEVGCHRRLNEDEDRMEVVFYIHEGPRYNVGSISFIGNTVYPEEALSPSLKLTGGDPYDREALNKDIGTIKDLYGSNGYVFADAVPDLRFHLEPGVVDIIYRLKEGQQYRIGDINVTIKGDNPHTRHATILNRLSMRPGDIADIRQFRASERRIKASGLFNVDPSKGDLPRVVFTPPEESEIVADRKNRASGPRTGDPDSYRGQSPDPLPSAPVQRMAAYPKQPLPVSAQPAGTQQVATQQVRTQQAAPPHRASAGTSAPVQQRPPATAAPRRSSAPPGGLLSPPASAPEIRMQSPDSSGYAGYGGYGGGYGGRAVQTISANPTPVTQAHGVGAGSSLVTPAQFAEPAQQNDPWAETMPPSGGSVPQDFGTLPPPGQFLNGPEVIPPSQPTLPVEIIASEAQTGRFMLGAGVNSNAGLVGSIILDEQNFDWKRLPTSWEDFRSGRAFRGAGQKFRLEAAPGTVVQRYLFNFAEPYLFDTPVSFGLSGYYFNRYYRDWLEQRLGGRITFGYQFTPDFSGNVGLRAEDVVISEPRVQGVPALDAVLGHTSLYSVRAGLAHDTRDSTFLPTEGHYITTTFEYFMGTFQYPWFSMNAQKHWLLRERPDGTGRHTFSYYNQLGFSGSDTPIYERFYAGGFSTLRGFQFRGASPQQSPPGPPPQPSVLVGGTFQFLNSVEYMFPVTADDTFKAVVFCDFGTVEEQIEMSWDDYRIAPGAGVRITIPAISPAPIAIDFAVPVKHADGDLLQNISFFVGFGR